MSFNISDFNAKINEHGIAKTNLFFARITMPRSLLNEFGQISVTRDLEFYCKTVTLPEMDITTGEVQPQGFGPVVRRPQAMNFPILPVSFMVDSNFGVMKLYHRWMQSIINYDTSGGQFAGVNNALPFEMGYKKDYSATMQVAVYSQNTREVEYLYEFSGLYPINVGSIQASWESAGEVMTLPVGFSYDGLKVTGAKTGEVLADRPGSFTGKLLNWFSTINSVANTLQSIQRPTDVQDAINQVNNVNNIIDSF
tara:strand:+ start:243 stop:1001 length:759 start_codon:yes stop_codon:yes gene_type:complete